MNAARLADEREAEDEQPVRPCGCAHACGAARSGSRSRRVQRSSRSLPHTGARRPAALGSARGRSHPPRPAGRSFDRRQEATHQLVDPVRPRPRAGEEADHREDRNGPESPVQPIADERAQQRRHEEGETDLREEDEIPEPVVQTRSWATCQGARSVAAASRATPPCARPAKVAAQRRTTKASTSTRPSPSGRISTVWVPESSRSASGTPSGGIRSSRGRGRCVATLAAVDVDVGPAARSRSSWRPRPTSRPVNVNRARAVVAVAQRRLAGRTCSALGARRPRAGIGGQRAVLLVAARREDRPRPVRAHVAPPSVARIAEAVLAPMVSVRWVGRRRRARAGDRRIGAAVRR